MNRPENEFEWGTYGFYFKTLCSKCVSELYGLLKRLILVRIVVIFRFIYIYIYRLVLLLSLERDIANQVQILDDGICISLRINTLGKGMNPIILPPVVGKQEGRIHSLN